MPRFTRHVVVACLATACAGTDPVTVMPDSGDDTTVPTGFCNPVPTASENVSSCMPAADDYRPRDSNSANDTWPACISDDNTYHPIQATISTIARVAAFEEIATKLWKNQKTPTAQDFLDARVVYAQAEGLDSRVQRREDVHYAAPAGGAKCSEAGIPAQYPDRCVGPAKLLPILNDAFARGANGESPLVHAARIEASLLWFLYVSSLSEVMSCTTKAQDCDSAWAYYTGGTARGLTTGLSTYVNDLGPETHERAYDATLAVRCWRNLDNETTGTATNLALRDLARNQLDRATLRGIALIVKHRFLQLPCSANEPQEASFTFVKTLVPLLDRGARELNPTHADTLLAQAQKATAAEVDVAAATAALDALFPCP